MRKSADAFRTISEVSAWLDSPTHVLRFWESKFPQIKPVKRAGGRRYYRPEDMMLLGGIKQLLHNDGITIKGVQKILKEQGVKHVSSLSPDIDDPDAHKSDAPVSDAAPEATEPVPKTAETVSETATPVEPAAADADPEPLQLTPSEHVPAPRSPQDARIEDGTFAAEDTPWAKPAPHNQTPPPTTPIAPTPPTGEYVRRFGFVADELPTEDVDDAETQPIDPSDLGHLRPGPAAHLRYRDRQDIPIYPARSYASATLAQIGSVAEKLAALTRSN